MLTMLTMLHFLFRWEMESYSNRALLIAGSRAAASADIPNVGNWPTPSDREWRLCPLSTQQTRLSVLLSPGSAVHAKLPAFRRPKEAFDVAEIL
jgi:hypothetical protein